MAAERNLVIVHSPHRQSLSDFIEIKAKMAERAPDIEVFVLTNGQRHARARELAVGRPTLVFSPVELLVFAPLRGKIYAGKAHSKMQEIQRLVAGGIPVPRSIMVSPGLKLDPDTFGPFTVLKPNAGFQGRGVRLVRTRDVRFVDPKSWPVDDPRYGLPLIAQMFVDTGEYARSYRVMTVFGRPIYSVVSRSLEPRSFALDPRGTSPLEEPIAANSGKRWIETVDVVDVVDLAKRVARVFPELPALGIDIVRQAATDRLYVLEVNSGGGIWHISSDHGLKQKAEYGFDLYNQFGALDVIADALIEVTRREAT